MGKRGLSKLEHKLCSGQWTAESDFHRLLLFNFYENNSINISNFVMSGEESTVLTGFRCELPLIEKEPERGSSVS